MKIKGWIRNKFNKFGHWISPDDKFLINRKLDYWQLWERTITWSDKPKAFSRRRGHFNTLRLAIKAANKI